VPCVWEQLKRHTLADGCNVNTPFTRNAFKSGGYMKSAQCFFAQYASNSRSSTMTPPRDPSRVKLQLRQQRKTVSQASLVNLRLALLCQPALAKILRLGPAHCPTMFQLHPRQELAQSIPSSFSAAGITRTVDWVLRVTRMLLFFQFDMIFPTARRWHIATPTVCGIALWV